MRYQEVRQFNFPLHRYLSLVVGIILAIVGLTGSALVFQHELDRAIVIHQYGHIVPQAHFLSPEIVLNKVDNFYATKQPIKITAIELPSAPDHPYQIKAKTIDKTSIDLWINPYTGSLIVEHSADSFFKLIHKLHDHLLLGKVGTIEIGKIIVGIAALLFLVINLTGIALWDGWRKFKQGFSIKWQAKPLRVNYDIHKIVGIIAAIFLIFTSLTGFLWSFRLHQPIAHLITLSRIHPLPQKLKSNLIKDQKSLSLLQILQIADSALPGAMTTKVKLPEQPSDSFKVHKKFPQEHGERGHSQVVIDQYSGNVLAIRNGLHLSPYEQVLNGFEEIHYGTFAGLPTRILYVFIGITPLILYITSLVMYYYRRPKLKVTKKSKDSGET